MPEKRVLIMDGDEESRMILRPCLEGLGYRTELITSADDFGARRIDLKDYVVVICDLDDRSETWRRCLDLVRDGRLKTQIVLGSRSANHREWIDALQQGVFDLLVKPFEVCEVERIMSNAISFNYNVKFQVA